MDDKLSRVMPKNKTGIYASEIRTMLVPNHTETYNMNTISLTNHYPDQIGYRQHSAFKIRVKPRQALASVNTKLMEQYQRPNTKASLHQENIQYNTADDYDEDKTVVNVQKDEAYEQTAHELILLNTQAFRPSTVRKKTKAMINSADNRKSLAYQRNKSYSSKYINTTEERIRLNKSHSPNSKEVMSRSKLNKTEFAMSLKPKTFINLKSEEHAKVDFEYEDQFKSSSESAMNTPHAKTDPLPSSKTISVNKSTLDLFNEILESINLNTNTNNTSNSNFNNSNTNNIRPNSNINRSKTNTTFRSTNCRPITQLENYNNSIKPVAEKNPEPAEPSQEIVIKNLSEEQFLNLLKEYRKTQSLNLNSVLEEKGKNENESNGNSKSTKIVNLHGEFMGYPTQNSFFSSRSNKLFRLTSAVSSSTSSSLTSACTNINSNNNYNNNSNANTNLNKAPEYFVKYLNQKIFLKNSKNLVGILTTNKSNNKDINNVNSNKNNTGINAEQNAKNLNDNGDDKQQQQATNTEQKFQHVKILNFPTVAN